MRTEKEIKIYLGAMIGFAESRKRGDPVLDSALFVIEALGWTLGLNGQEYDLINETIKSKPLAEGFVRLAEIYILKNTVTPKN